MNFWLFKSTYIVGLVFLVVAKFLLPDFLKYGKTLKQNKAPKSVTARLMHYTVPKSTFSHFYVLSSCLSVLTLCAYPQYGVVWLFLCHSLRRLYETLFVSAYNERSRMNWSHYLVGLWFYTSLHIILNVELYNGNIKARFPSMALMTFCMAGWDQHQNHKILAKLIKYSLPQTRFFRWVCCPHYTDEILIYTSLLAASREFIWPLIWVVASLSLAGTECQKYYEEKFGPYAPRWALLPCVL